MNQLDFLNKLYPEPTPFLRFVVEESTRSAIISYSVEMYCDACKEYHDLRTAFAYTWAVPALPESLVSKFNAYVSKLNHDSSLNNYSKRDAILNYYDWFYSAQKQYFSGKQW